MKAKSWPAPIDFRKSSPHVTSQVGVHRAQRIFNHWYEHAEVCYRKAIDALKKVQDREEIAHSTLKELGEL